MHNIHTTSCNSEFYKLYIPHFSCFASLFFVKGEKSLWELKLSLREKVLL